MVGENKIGTENPILGALVKFNKSLAVNKQLRSTIDNLRRERLVFDNIYKKFEKELMEQKKAMAEIIEMTQAKIIAWREKVEKEHQAYIQEVKDLDRSYEQDRKLKEFMATKAADRLEKILEASGGNLECLSHKKGNKKKDGVSPKFSSQESLSESLEFYEKAFAEIKTVTGVSDMEGLVQRFRAVEDNNFSLFNYVNEINNEIEKYLEEITELQKEIDKMKVENIVADEERKKVMASLENALNTCNEKHLLHEKQYNDTLYTTSEMRKGVNKLVKIFQTMRFSFSGRQAQINYNNQHNHNPEDSGNNNSESHTQQNTVDELGNPINGEEQQQQNQTESNFIPTDNLKFDLGSTATTDTNLIQILGVIEHKMNELMTLNYMFNTPRKIGSAGSNQPTTPSQPNNPSITAEDKFSSGSGGTGGAENTNNSTAPGTATGTAPKEGVLIMPLLGTIGGLLGQGPIAPLGNITIVAPSTGDDHDSEENISDEEDRPMTREELKQKTLRGLSKRERTQGQNSGTQLKLSKQKRQIGEKRSS
ncbi:Coiled-coil domain-containing protein 63 [Lobulomyces angularis]|nr:Coiled-coil domain-containing protein 63 [Lobulomyces angularis]